MTADTPQAGPLPTGADRREMLVRQWNPAGLRLFVALGGLYLGQSIPIYLLAAALPAVMRETGASLTSVGMIGLLILPWMLKFLWAPFIDRHAPLPIGHRRSWILLLQLAVIAALAALAQLSPVTDIVGIMLLGCLIALLVGSLEVAIDGYAVERLSAAQRATGNALQGAGTAAGVILGGSCVLILYEHVGWTLAVLTAAGMIGLSLVALLVMPEAVGERPPSRGRPKADRPSLMRFFRRPEALQALAFALTFRASEGFVKAMENPFLIDNGLSLKAIGILDGASAALVGLIGSAVAAIVIRYAGLWRCVYGLGVARTVCFVGFAYYAWASPDLAWLLIGITLFNTIIRYMEIVGLYSLFMGASARVQAGTDFTLLSSAQLVVFMLGSMTSGMIADAVGYHWLFAMAVLLSIAGLVLSMRTLPRHHPAWRTE